MRPLHRLARVLPTFALATSCGGPAAPTSSWYVPDSGAVDSGAADSGAADSPRLVAACPATPPAQSAPCISAVTCEYGTAFDFQCTTLATCDSSKTWHVTPPASCTDANPGVGPACLPTFAAASTTTTCTTLGTVCDYPEGRCGCAYKATIGPTYPDAGPTPMLWYCQAPLGPGCPSVRPPNGEPCTGSQTCAYGARCVAGSVEMSCSGGAWVGDLPLPCNLP